MRFCKKANLRDKTKLFSYIKFWLNKRKFLKLKKSIKSHFLYFLRGSKT